MWRSFALFVSGNTLTVRYVYDGIAGYNDLQLPMPMVAGRER